MLSAVAVAVLVLLAGAVLSVPARTPVTTGEKVERSGSGVRRWWLRVRARRRPSPEVGRVLVEVAARLRAGADLTTAWQRSLPQPSPPWSTPVLAALGLGGPQAGSGDTGERRRWPPQRPRAQPDVAAAIAACRLAHRSGAPLAEVIDVVVGGIAETREAAELRRTALAGPRATARLLAWLPLAGIGLGAVLGADPVAVLLGGGVGGLCLVLGGALFVAGRRWVRVLVAQAERAGG